MSSVLLSFITILAIPSINAQEMTEVEAAQGTEQVFLEAPAAKGAGMYCEYAVHDIRFGAFAPLIAILLDEGAVTDQNSKYLQIDMTYVSDEDETITHNIVNDASIDSEEDSFLVHWRKAPWYSLELLWEQESLFRYQVTLAGSVVATGRYQRTDFDPKFFRVSLSGLRAGVFCEES
jgi:hypothetical protein